MIKHVVLLDWKEGTTAEAIQQVTSAFAALEPEIEGLLSYTFGSDAQIYRGNADYALIADFADEAHFKAYVTHPKHQALLTEITGPILESFQSVQIVVDH